MLIAGLPGSGKSRLADRYRGAFTVIDDPDTYDDITSKIRDNDALLIADINFCVPSVRERAIALIQSIRPDASIEWIFFENAPAKCRRNVRYRNDGRKVEGSISRLAKEYVIPDDALIIEVWQSEDTNERR